ncbi:MAG: hypothetical protein NUV81_02570 [bacterium]|nr:hypothetical protein [bacterium]
MKGGLVFHVTIIFQEVYEDLRSHPDLRMWLVKYAPCFVRTILLSGLDRGGVILYTIFKENGEKYLIFGLFPEQQEPSITNPRLAWFKIQHAELHEIDSIRLILGGLITDKQTIDFLDRLYGQYESLPLL